MGILKNGNSPCGNLRVASGYRKARTHISVCSISFQEMFSKLDDIFVLKIKNLER